MPFSVDAPRAVETISFMNYLSLTLASIFFVLNVDFNGFDVVLADGDFA